MYYVGLVTGIVGAITGIVGAILGYKGYRAAQQSKTLDLRLELRRAEADLRSDNEHLPDLMQQSHDSRVNVSAARGIGDSGYLQAWRRSWEQDMATVNAPTRSTPCAWRVWGPQYGRARIKTCGAS
jgi:hypothetical protein